MKAMEKMVCSQQGFIDFATAQKLALRSLRTFQNKTILNQFEIKGRKVITYSLKTKR